MAAAGLTTHDLAAARGIYPHAVLRGLKRGNVPQPDAGGRGGGYRWDPTRLEVEAYMATPEQVAAVARELAEGHTSPWAASRALGLSWRAYARALDGEHRSQYSMRLKLWEAWSTQARAIPPAA